VIENNAIQNLENMSPPDYKKCKDFHEKTDEENGTVNQAGNIRGISASAAQ
jgi:hypothetical protein